MVSAVQFIDGLYPEFQPGHTVVTRPVEHPRTIRSFVRRAGRLTEAQQRAIDSQWPKWGIDYTPQTIDLDAIFGRPAPVTLEIGFGNGDTLVANAAAAPERDFLGVEVHEPGVGRLLQNVEKLGLVNVRVICHDVVEVLSQQIAQGSIDQVNIYFPDPWPKKRHHKRRLVQTAFLQLLHPSLTTGGKLHIATDWQAYAEHIHETLQLSPLFENALPGTTLDAALTAGKSERDETKFERRGRKLGHEVWDFIYRSI